MEPKQPITFVNCETLKESSLSTSLSFLGESGVEMSPKRHHCCVPGCLTYGTTENFLPIPSESFWRSQWLFRIPRKDWVVDSDTLVCRKHFQEPISTLRKVVKDEVGKDVGVLLSTEAIPTLFSEPTASSTKTLYTPPHMFYIFARDCVGPSTPKELVEVDPAMQMKDFVIDFDVLKSTYATKLHNILKEAWRVVENSSDIVFYTVDFSEAPRIPTMIRIDKLLIVSVTLDGRMVDPIDLTWILPVSCKLNRWSQLQIMLTKFGK